MDLEPSSISGCERTVETDVDPDGIVVLTSPGTPCSVAYDIDESWDRVVLTLRVEGGGAAGPLVQLLADGATVHEQQVPAAPDQQASIAAQIAGSRTLELRIEPLDGAPTTVRLVEPHLEELAPA